MSCRWKVFCGTLVASSVSVSGRRKAFGRFTSVRQLIWPQVVSSKAPCNSELPLNIVGCSVGDGQSQVTTWLFDPAA